MPQFPPTGDACLKPTQVRARPGQLLAPHRKSGQTGGEAKGEKTSLMCMSNVQPRSPRGVGFTRLSHKPLNPVDAAKQKCKQRGESCPPWLICQSIFTPSPLHGQLSSRHCLPCPVALHTAATEGRIGFSEDRITVHTLLVWPGLSQPGLPFLSPVWKLYNHCVHIHRVKQS